MEGVKVRQHQWVEFKITPIEVFTGPDGQAVPMSLGKESQVTIGCFACNLSLDEGWGSECTPEKVEGGESDVI